MDKRLPCRGQFDKLKSVHGKVLYGLLDYNINVKITIDVKRMYLNLESNSVQIRSMLYLEQHDYSYHEA